MVSFDEKNRFAEDREYMVRRHLMGRDITDARVLEVMGALERQEFVPAEYAAQAYSDGPLPIGIGQTISQPYIVALMTQQLRVDSDCEVLEIGTGSGYQTAILAKLARRVYSIERHGQLSENAQAVLGRLGIDNVEYYIGDGSKGWLEQREFDRVMITAAVPSVPEAIVEQVCQGGLIIAPTGGEYSQDLMVYEKKQNRLASKMICGCRFVKLIGEHGFKET